MVLFSGILLLLLAVSLLVVWWSPAVAGALQVLLVLVLVLAGTILTLIGYSEKKARREYESMEVVEKQEEPEPDRK